MYVLGLRVTGQEVTLEDGGASFVKQLFHGTDIATNLNLAKLRDSDINNDENVEDFCRLYVLLALATFYFPRSSRNISTIPFIC